MITSEDPLHLNQVLRNLGIGLDYKQLAAGDFRGDIVARDIDNVTCFHESQRVPLEITGAIAHDTYFFIMDDRDDEGLKFNGSIAKAGQLFVYPPGSELVCVTSKSVDATQILAPRSLINDKLHSRLQNNSWKLEEINGLFLAPSHHETLKKMIREIIHSGATSSSSELASSGFLIDNLVEALLDAYPELPETKVGRPRKDNFKVYKKAKDYISAHLQQSLTIEDLCNHVCLSQRQLERVFLAQAGHGIKKHIDICKLNAIRVELLCNSASETNVQREASKYAINHMGRFSKAYAEFFGEYPLHTLRMNS